MQYIGVRFGQLQLDLGRPERSTPRAASGRGRSAGAAVWWLGAEFCLAVHTEDPRGAIADSLQLTIFFHQFFA